MLLRRRRAKGDPFSGLPCLSWAFEPQEGRKVGPAIQAWSSRKRKAKAPKLCFPYQRCQIDTEAAFLPFRQECTSANAWNCGSSGGVHLTSPGPPGPRYHVRGFSGEKAQHP